MLKQTSNNEAMVVSDDLEPDSLVARMLSSATYLVAEIYLNEPAGCGVSVSDSDGALPLHTYEGLRHTTRVPGPQQRSMTLALSGISSASAVYRDL